MRRGGQFIYALDVNNPNSPKFLWKIDNTTTGFSELGQTWSNPTAVSSVAGYSNPILVFGAVTTRPWKTSSPVQLLSQPPLRSQPRRAR